jgi:hypothetical protein
VKKQFYNSIPEKITPTVVEHNGTKAQRYPYTVTEPNSGSNQEKYLTVGKRTSEDIDSHLSEGHTHCLKFKVNF